jgi:hypothetical protein
MSSRGAVRSRPAWRAAENEERRAAPTSSSRSRPSDSRGSRSCLGSAARGPCPPRPWRTPRPARSDPRGRGPSRTSRSPAGTAPRVCSDSRCPPDPAGARPPTRSTGRAPPRARRHGAVRARGARGEASREYALVPRRRHRPRASRMVYEAGDSPEARHARAARGGCARARDAGARLRLGLPCRVPRVDSRAVLTVR